MRNVWEERDGEENLTLGGGWTVYRQKTAERVNSANSKDFLEDLSAPFEAKLFQLLYNGRSDLVTHMCNVVCNSADVQLVFSPSPRFVNR